MAKRSAGRAAPNLWSETGAIEQANQVDDWLAIEPDGTVTVFSGKVELGTGVETALAQIVAEELDVPFERVRMVMGDTARTPDEGYTAGSATIRFGGFALRHASAEARRALFEMASDRLDSALDELVVRDGVITVSHPPAREITYAELMGGKKFRREITLDAPLKRPEEYRIVGKPMARVDLPRKFTGAPSFIQDVRLPGMLHGRVVRPPSPGAKLVSLDENAVQDAQVVRLGDFVGVVSEREEQAIRAAKQLKLTWQATTRFPQMNELSDYLRRQPTTDEVVTRRGKVDAALKRASTHVSANYFQPYQAHASTGPSCAVADFHADQVVVWSSTQGVYPLRGALADLLQLPPERVQVIHVEGAGSYGHNGSDDAAADAAILSRAVGKPVRVQWSREDEFRWEPYAPAMVMQVHGGLNKQGNVAAWAYDVWTPPHGARPRVKSQLLAGQEIFGQPPPPPQWFGGGDRNAPTNYAFPNQRVVAHWLSASPLRASSFRSLGAAANTFANESFMDELAATAHIDPLEFRLRHLTDPRAIEVLTAAAQRAAWGAALAPGEGRGLAFAQYENDEAYVATVAHIQVNAATGEARVKRVVVAHDCGLIINPDGLKNQIEGNVIQATSRALKEQVTFDETGITSRDWESYPILKFSEVPTVEIVLIDRPDQPAVGAGEPATITIAPAIANALFAAVGVRIRELPITAAKVLRALREKETGQSTPGSAST
ncbi:MAG: xanthine dehydrogenase family protein molybdopterin-binding subunit [Chloroflexota bacterium]|nr:xanthine dehydrogenase family protein molybdopterin-binding subunit [Chloroflexota bacterium]